MSDLLWRSCRSRTNLLLKSHFSDKRTIPGLVFLVTRDYIFWKHNCQIPVGGGCGCIFHGIGIFYIFISLIFFLGSIWILNLILEALMVMSTFIQVNFEYLFFFPTSSKWKVLFLVSLGWAISYSKHTQSFWVCLSFWSFFLWFILNKILFCYAGDLIVLYLLGESFNIVFGLHFLRTDSIISCFDWKWNFPDCNA